MSERYWSEKAIDQKLLAEMVQQQQDLLNDLHIACYELTMAVRGRWCGAAHMTKVATAYEAAFGPVNPTETMASLMRGESPAQTAEGTEPSSDPSGGVTPTLAGKR